MAWFEEGLRVAGRRAAAAVVFCYPECGRPVLAAWEAEFVDANNALEAEATAAAFAAGLRLGCVLGRSAAAGAGWAGLG